MAYVIARGHRFTGYFYDAGGKRRSAGTYDTHAEALVRAKDKEGTVTPRPAASGGGLGDYANYATTWIAREAKLSPRTKTGYESNLRVHILPLIGHLQVEEITQDTVTNLLSTLAAQGIGPGVRAQCKAALGRSLKPLVPQFLSSNPTHGVVVDLPPAKPFRLVDPDDFRRIADALPNEGCRLFGSFLVLSGARFGEASEIRVSDVEFSSNEVSILRRVVETGKTRTDDSRFRVLSGTKAGTRHGRTVSLPHSYMRSLQAWVEQRHLGPNDLVFPHRLLVPGASDDEIEVRLGATFSKEARTFQHGTAYAYSAGGCRCEDCRTALRQYRRELRRKNLAKRRVRPVGVNRSGHLPNDQWRRIWRAAIKASGLDWFPRTHDLRHACATHLVASGVSLYEVKEILGHRSIETTLKYQHRVDRMRSKAVEAVSEFL